MIIVNTFINTLYCEIQPLGSFDYIKGQSYVGGYEDVFCYDIIL